MAETQRIQYLIAMHGEALAKQKCLEICQTYTEFIEGKHRGKDGTPVMTMFYNKMKESIVELEGFINS